jgi:hypothetical protein
MPKAKVLVIILLLLIVVLVTLIPLRGIFSQARTPHIIQVEGSAIESIGPISDLNNGKWKGSFRTHDGTIYLHRHFKSSDGGKTAILQEDIDVEELTREPERATISSRGIFYASGGTAKFVQPGVYRIRAWRSMDELKTLQREEAIVYIPQGPKRAAINDNWYLTVHRSIIEMPDGSWLMTMFGNFDEDNLVPYESDAKLETGFMTRAFVVTSNDKGHSWHFLSDVAVPKSGDPIGEGFGEPTMTLLDDGRLLIILRTGHHFPLYAAWSADGGKSWTPPSYTGLDRACDPDLIKLKDGRLALSWGRRYPEGWSKITSEGDQARFKYPGEGYTNLAISSDNGATWVNHKIAHKTGSTYSTIFEVEPNMIFFQVDQWIWRVKLRAKADPPESARPSRSAA